MKRFLPAVFALLAPVWLLAQSLVPATPPTTTDTTLLWKITGSEVAAPSYLFGTIHLIPAEDYFMPNKVVRAMNEVEEFVFEIDPRDMQDMGALMGLMTKINMRGDTSLEDLLTPARYDSVRNYFEAAGMPFMFFKKMKPMFLSAMVGQDISQLQMGMQNAGVKSYEMELTEVAQRTEKPISGLETMEFQLSIFDLIPYEAQAEMLYRAVVADASGAEGADQMSVMVDLYKRQAISEMASMISAESEEVAGFEELLLTKRNQSWVPLIREKITGESGVPSLFAVGAGHLGGAQGVIALLRASGFTVEAVY